MSKKKKEIPMPTIGKKPIKKSWLVATVSGVVVLLCVLYWVSQQPTKQYVEKEVVNNYACQIVDVDQESGFFAVKCITK